MRIKKIPRDQTFSVTCTAEEKEQVFYEADKRGMTVSSYVRWLLKQNAERESERGEDDGK